MEKRKSNGWVGWIYFAAVMLMVAGGLNIIAGLTGIFNPEYFVVTEGGALLLFDYETWGWIHLIAGVAAVALGVYLTRGKMWARAIVVGVIVFNMIVNIAALSIYPWWSILALIINAFVLYAITVHGEELTQ